MKGLMKVECDPACGFLIRSHDRKEIEKAVVGHARQVHNMRISMADVDKKMMPA